jgi:hypothetical protein
LIDPNNEDDWESDEESSDSEEDWDSDSQNEDSEGSHDAMEIEE